MMKDKPNLQIWKTAILGLILCGTSAFWWPSTGTPEERGQEIFRKGSSPSGQKIVALMSGAEIPATVLPCASCHGLDGKGRPEGGVSPSNLNWNALTKDYTGERANGRTHSAYTTSSLKRAITMGLDPAGNTLNSTMPRYQMSQEDMNDLVAYLKVLGQESVAGLTDSTLLIGSLLRSEPGLAEMNSAVSQIIQAYFTEINQVGGLFNRQLEWIPIVSESQERAPFALVSSWIDEQWEKMPAGTPVVGALSQFPETDFNKNRGLFYLMPGLNEMATALGGMVQGHKTAIVYEADSLRKTLVQAFKKGIEASDSGAVIEFAAEGQSAQTLAELLQQQAFQQVFLLADPAFEHALVEKWSQLESPPELLLLGSFTTINIYKLPQIWQGKVILAYPQWIASVTEKGRAMGAYLQQKYTLPTAYQQSQWAALSGAILLVDALKKAGHDLSQEKLIDVLENTYQLETGLLPPLSYHANRRIGSEQVFLVKYLGGENGLKLID